MANDITTKTCNSNSKAVPASASPVRPALLPIAALVTTLSLSMSANVQAQSSGNTQALGPTVTFGGQQNGNLIQGQTTLTNIIVENGETTIRTSATGNGIEGINVRSFRSDSGTLGGMQTNSGRVLAVTQLVSDNGLPTRIDQLNSRTQSVGNSASFSTTTGAARTGTIAVEKQNNTGSIEAKTEVVNMTVNNSQTVRTAVVSTFSTGNHQDVTNALGVSGQHQVNTGPVKSETEYSIASGGSLTKLEITTGAMANNLSHNDVTTVNFSNLGNRNAVQDNGGAVTSATTVNNVSVTGATPTLINTFAVGNNMNNTGNSNIIQSGTAGTVLQNNAGSISGTTTVNNINAGSGRVSVVTAADGNRLSNVDVQSFQQGSLTSPNNTVLQQNSGRVEGSTTLANTVFNGDLAIATFANGNNATVSWSSSNSSQIATMGSQINTGEVSAITNWRIDPTRSVNIDSHATGNSIRFAPAGN